MKPCFWYGNSTEAALTALKKARGHGPLQAESSSAVSTKYAQLAVNYSDIACIAFNMPAHDDIVTHALFLRFIWSLSDLPYHNYAMSLTIPMMNFCFLSFYMALITNFTPKTTTPQPGESVFVFKPLNEVYASYEELYIRTKELRTQTFQPVLHAQPFSLAQCVEIDVAFIKAIINGPMGALLAGLTAQLNQHKDAKRPNYAGYCIRDAQMRDFVIISAVFNGYIVAKADFPVTDADVAFIARETVDCESSPYMVVSSSVLTIRKGAFGGLTMTKAPQFLESPELEAYFVELRREPADYAAMHNRMNEVAAKSRALAESLAIMYYQKLPFVRETMAVPFKLNDETVAFFQNLKQKFGLKIEEEIIKPTFYVDGLIGEQRAGLIRLAHLKPLCDTECNGMCDMCVMRFEEREKAHKKPEIIASTTAPVTSTYNEKTYEDYKTYLSNVQKLQGQLEQVSVDELCVVLEAFASTIDAKQIQHVKQQVKKEAPIIDTAQVMSSMEQTRELIAKAYQNNKNTGQFKLINSEVVEAIPIYTFLQTYRELLNLEPFSFIEFYAALVQGTKDEQRLLQLIDEKSYDFNKLLHNEKRVDLSTLLPLYNGEVNSLVYQVLLALVFQLYKDLPKAEPDIIIHKNGTKPSSNRKTGHKAVSSKSESYETDNESEASSEQQSSYSSSGYAASENYDTATSEEYSREYSYSQDQKESYYYEYDEESTQKPIKTSEKSKKFINKIQDNEQSVKSELTQPEDEENYIQSYKDLASIKYIPGTYSKDAPILGSRDAVWAKQLLFYISRVSNHSRDAECLEFILPLLSLFWRENDGKIVLKQLLMNAERGPLKHKHVWDGAFGTFGKIEGKYPITFYNEFFNANIKYQAKPVDVSEEEDIQRLQGMTNDIYETLLSQPTLKFQQIDVSLKIRFLKWLINQVLQSAKLNNFINSIDTLKDKLQQEKKQLKAEIQTFNSSESQKQRKISFDALVSKINDEIAVLQRKYNRNIQVNQLRWAEQNKEQIQQKEKELKNMNFQEYQQNLLDQITVKQKVLENRIARLEYASSCSALGSDVLDNQYFIFYYSDDKNILLQTIENQYYIISNELQPKVIRWCQDIDLITQLQKLNTEQLISNDKIQKDSTTVLLDTLAEKEKVDSKDINSYLESLSDLPIYFRYMLFQNGPRNAVLSEQFLEKFTSQLWNDK